MTDLGADSRLGLCDWLLVTAAVVSAMGLAAPAVSSQPLVLDEHASYWLCAGDVPLSILQRSTDYAATPPVGSWVQRGALELFGKQEWSLRLPSVLAYVLAVVVMFVGCRRTMGVRAAALACLALAWHPDVVDEVRVGRPYGLVLLEMVALTALSLRMLRADGEVTRPVAAGLCWGLIAGAALWTHILTIPPVALAGVTILFVDVWKTRRVRISTVIAGVTTVMFGVLLLPQLLRIWSWRYGLNDQIRTVGLLESLGSFVWVTLPIGGLLAFISVIRRKPTDASPEADDRRSLLLLAVVGLVPLIVVAMAVGELPSLNNPRYRLPLATAQAGLLGLLLSKQKSSVSVAALVLAIAGSWWAVGRSPTTFTRLDTAQAAVWKQMGETLKSIVNEQGLQQAGVFVQSGLIEATLVPVMFDDPGFHGYATSRLGRFYADTPNPRYALPFFWRAEDSEMLAFFSDRISAAPGEGDLFVAAATDTDVNRAALAQFAALLQQSGYELTPIAEHEPWAVLYHARRIRN